MINAGGAKCMGRVLSAEGGCQMQCAKCRGGSVKCRERVLNAKEGCQMHHLSKYVRRLKFIACSDFCFLFLCSHL